MQLGPGETEAGPWRVEPFGDFVRALVAAAGHPVKRPRIIAVDGRGGGGKTTLANRLAEAMAPDAVVVFGTASGSSSPQEIISRRTGRTAVTAKPPNALSRHR
jgi:ABC-type branched-subunit amino acid transport system ATPase component